MFDATIMLEAVSKFFPSLDGSRIDASVFSVCATRRDIRIERCAIQPLSKS